VGNEKGIWGKIRQEAAGSARSRVSERQRNSRKKHDVVEELPISNLEAGWGPKKDERGKDRGVA